jgi:hypothetical protein
MGGTVSRRRNRIGEQFIAHRLTMRESIAWNALPDNARRVLDRLEREHMHHGSAENGSLQCLYDDFEKVGIRRQSIALAIRQCVALGFLEITKQGVPAISAYRAGTLYRITYLHGCGKSPAPTDEWAKVQSLAEAEERLRDAGSIKSEHHVRRAKKARNAPSLDEVEVCKPSRTLVRL